MTARVDINAQDGSPPRVRGKRRQLHMRRQEIRITPARAGKTAIKGRDIVRKKDHPRACGENSESAADRRPCMGSPPRVRGKHNGVER